MEDPKITWYVKQANTDEQYEETEDYYAGTYTPSHHIDVLIQLWNNRFGLEDVSALSNFYITISFEHIEDMSLLDYCSICMNHSDVLTLKKTGHKAVLEFPRKVTLSGTKNDGQTQNNEDHYIDLEFSFDAAGEKLKENDLKSMYFQIVQLG